MLISDLIYELRFHKFKILFLFIFLVIISIFIIKYGQIKYIKQILYIEIKDEIEYRIDDNFEKLNRFDTNDIITVSKYENKFLSPAYENYSLNLNKNNFYKSLLNKDLAKKITNDYRPGYNIIVFYNASKRRYEITIQLFDDDSTFNLVIGQIQTGIIDYFNQEEFRNNLDEYFSKKRDSFNSFKKDIIDHQKEYTKYIANYERLLENAKNKYKSNILDEDSLSKTVDVHSYFLSQSRMEQYLLNTELDLFLLKQKKLVLDEILNEFDYKEKIYESHFDLNNIYEIYLSEKAIIKRGKFPEYVIALFIVLFISISSLISYFSLIRKK